MSDLVKRLRKFGHIDPHLAADRIEKLERELAAERVHSATAWSEHAKQIDMQMAATMRASGAEFELAAEKELADRLWRIVKGKSNADEVLDTCNAYRKARGL